MLHGHVNHRTLAFVFLRTLYAQRPAFEQVFLASNGFQCRTNLGVPDRNVRDGTRAELACTGPWIPMLGPSPTLRIRYIAMQDIALRDR